ncbi:DUF4236 domain-containing protein [Clostridium perfringens]|uniref:DUF4236 domain-containing protein n=1 Tax=Clostridium perfringens TaxID=1502 RepID=UPI00111DE0AF|nr:DUF4236 domain-containing protein [Clostridium perfringens]MDK0554364.1 DUF4236 domain-containing protein [Clostridium perfringens]TPE14377.1 DUF4236 domain-containing protein [Clostridium perfringens]
MGFSLRKSFKVGKNSKVNLSTEGGVGFSTSKKGARISVNKNGVNLYGGKGILRFTKHISLKKYFKY